MTLHKDLSGDELHPSKVTIASPNRTPAFVGEIVFNVDTLWIATTLQQSGWKPAIEIPTKPPTFSWIVDTAGDSLFAADVQQATLFYSPGRKAQNQLSQVFLEEVHTWTVGEDWKMGSPIDLAPSLSRYGLGCYTLLLSGTDAYSGSGQPLSPQAIEVVRQNPVEAIEVFPLPDEFQGLNGQPYSGVTGFEVKALIAEVLLRIRYD